MYEFRIDTRNSMLCVVDTMSSTYVYIEGYRRIEPYQGLYVNEYRNLLTFTKRVLGISLHNVEYYHNPRLSTYLRPIDLNGYTLSIVEADFTHDRKHFYKGEYFFRKRGSTIFLDRDDLHSEYNIGEELDSYVNCLSSCWYINSKKLDSYTRPLNTFDVPQFIEEPSNITSIDDLCRLSIQPPYTEEVIKMLQDTTELVQARFKLYITSKGVYYRVDRSGTIRRTDTPFEIKKNITLKIHEGYCLEYYREELRLLLQLYPTLKPIVTCSCCGNIMEEIDYGIYYKDHTKGICRSCLSYHYKSLTGRIYCKKDEIKIKVRGYHERPELKFKKHHLSKKESPFYGVELEMEAKAINTYHDIIINTVIKDEQKCYFNRDGSIDDGVELITMPCTLAYHKQGMGWGKILKSFSKSYKVNSGNCGLHIHRSKDDLNIKDMCFIAKLMSNNIKYFAQRVGRVSYKGIVEYAKAFTYRDSSYKDIIDNFNVDRLCTSRYRVVNFTNSKTIEFRLFGATLDKAQLFWDLQLVDLVVSFVKTCTIIQQVSLSNFKNFCNKHSFNLDKYYLDDFDFNTDDDYDEDDE